MSDATQLHDAATRLASVLEQRGTKIVFAESCTGGLVPATLARIPGISRFLCGSMVVYQTASKHRWLSIPEDLLDDPGPVSRECATAMALNVLEATPHADVAVSVTGHLGPDAPPEQDGLVYIAFARRLPRDETMAIVTEHRLPARGTDGTRIRIERQQSAAILVLETACHALLTMNPSESAAGT